MRSIVATISFLWYVYIKLINQKKKGRDNMNILRELGNLFMGGIAEVNHMISHNNFVEMVHQENLMQQMHQDMEQARMASTGIEFGGFNADPGMNPGMMNNGMF